MGVFDFEGLDVFVVAVEMVICVDVIAEGLPKGRGYMRDQLRRAANAVVLNIAEGAGAAEGRRKPSAARTVGYSPGDRLASTELRSGRPQRPLHRSSWLLGWD